MRTATASRRESNSVLREWCGEVTGRVLSIGSSNDGDNEGRTYREYFRMAESYTTSEYGDRSSGCDLSLDVRDMSSVKDGSYSAVFCSGVLEHVDDYLAGVRECHRVLTSGGVFLVGIPFRQAIHRPPQDFWRFTIHGVRYFLHVAGFKVEDLVGVDASDPTFPAAYWAKARKWQTA